MKKVPYLLLSSTLATALKEVYKLHWLFYLNELKDDNSHSFDACFHILVCDINFNEVLSTFVFFVFQCNE